MNYSFADRVNGLQPSVIREILKYASVPGMISLAAGNPAPEAFPVDDISKISAEVYSSAPIDALQYSVTEGYAPLKQAIKERYPELFGENDDVIITSGAQQVMNLATQSLCGEGDVIICEAPSFIGSLNAFRSFGARLVGVPLESDGMDIAALEKALDENPTARFIYVIPNFQNPAGIVTSLEKRHAIYDLAKKHGVMIVEDNPYGETRFEGENLPSIKTFDTDDIVIYAGSFSKVISPGLRVGYGIAPKPVLAKMTVCKQVSDVHTSIYSQMIVHKFMTGGNYDKHLENIRAIYRKKSGLMLSEMEKKLSPYLTWNAPSGGLFIWCELKGDIDMLDFCRRGVERNVAVVPGNAFLVDESQPCRSIRLNYSTPTDEQIVEGIERLRQLFEEIEGR